MTSFLIGLAILLFGGILYSKLCVRVFGPDDRQPPAYTKQDGVDFVPLPCCKNSLINLLNIADTDPIFGRKRTSRLTADLNHTVSFANSFDATMTAMTKTPHNLSSFK